MNRVAVVARYISDHSFILLYFHSFLNINLYLKKYSYIVISRKKVAQETREIAYCHSFLSLAGSFSKLKATSK